MWGSQQTSTFERVHHEKFHSVRVDGDVGFDGLRSRCTGELLSATLWLEPKLLFVTVLHSDVSLFKLLPADLLYTHLLLLALRDHELCSRQPHRDDLLLLHQCVCNGMFATMHASLLRKSLVFQIGISREEVPRDVIGDRRPTGVISRGATHRSLSFAHPFCDSVLILAGRKRILCGERST
jgi:hypothetical protein